MPDRTRPPAAVVDEQAPRSRRCETAEHTRDRAGRRGPRRCRIILIVAGGLLGPGYWLCGSVGDGGHILGKTPAEVHFAEFVLASVVVVVASWGLLLILGEAMLFALAVFKADDRERYDIYRNLMILWGYVLTLGIPRHFRRLPAQFGARSDDDDRPARRGGNGSGRDHGGHRQNDDRRPAEPGGRNGTRPSSGRQRPPDRTRTESGPASRDRARTESVTASGDQDRTAAREDARDRKAPPQAGDRQAAVRNRTGPRDRAGSRDRTPAREDTSNGVTSRDRTAPREGRKPARDRVRPPSSEAAVPKRPAPKSPAPKSPAPKSPAPERPAPKRPVAEERPGPLGPIFPPRPAAESEVAPMADPATGAVTPVAFTAGTVASSLADGIPAGELRNALDLLLRYAARVEGAAPRPATPDPKICDGKAFGIAAETGGDT
jgi:hypothetical protein